MAVGNGYSSAQILAMQKDAIRRVNEMQRAAQEKLRQTQMSLGEARPGEAARGNSVPQPVEVRHSGEASHLQQAHREEPKPVPAAPVPAEQAQSGGEAVQTAAGGPVVPESPLKGILSRLNLDEETVLLLLMLLLLVNEGADSKLIMALVYILL